MNNHSITERVIKNYIAGYNEFDIDKMLASCHENIVFENIHNGEITMCLKGLPALRKQAELSKTYFSARKQTIKSFKHYKENTEIEIDYHAVLAIDFPGGLKKGEIVYFSGKSIFVFENAMIVELTDIS